MRAPLTSLDRVSAWAKISGNADTVLINRLIASVSAAIRSWLPNVALDVSDVAEMYDGNGTSFMVLRQKPVIAINSITWPGVSLTEKATINPISSGYLLQEIQPPGIPQRLDLIGYCFPQGRAALAISYKVGYLISDEAQTVSNGQISSYLFFMSDQGVSYANGTPLTRVAANPAQGQYSVTADGLYSFNAADDSAEVLLSYGYCPEDIVQAATELVGERYKAKDRIGLAGQGVGGRETVTYFVQKDMSNFVRTLLESYVTSIPV